MIADFDFAISISIQKFRLSLSLVLLSARRTRNNRILNLIVKILDFGRITYLIVRLYPQIYISRCSRTLLSGLRSDNKLLVWEVPNTRIFFYQVLTEILLTSR